MFGASWKTTALGILAGLGMLIKNAVAILDSDPATNFSWEEVMAALGMFGIGLFAKDKNITGGTIKQSSVK